MDDSKHGRMTHRAHDPLNPSIVYITVPLHVAYTYMYRRAKEKERERERGERERERS